MEGDRRVIRCGQVVVGGCARQIQDSRLARVFLKGSLNVLEAVLKVDRHEGRCPNIG